MENKKDLLGIIFFLMLTINILIIVIGIFTFLWGGNQDTIIAGIIGATGSIIGGTMTLVGVSWGFKQQNKKEITEKHEKANYVFIELLPKMQELRNSIGILNKGNWGNEINNAYKAAVNLNEKSIELSFLASQVNTDVLSEVKTLQHQSERIKEYIDGREQRDLYEIRKDILIHLSNINKTDQELFKLVSKLKHSV